MNDDLRAASPSGLTLASLAQMPLEQRQHLTVATLNQLFQQTPQTALRQYKLLATTAAVPGLYLEYALASRENAQIAYEAVQAQRELRYSETLLNSIFGEYGPQRADTHEIMAMLGRVTTGAHKDVPTIPDTRVLGVRRSERERVAEPQPQGKPRGQG